MKPKDLYINKDIIQHVLERVYAIENADENVQCSIENIEMAYKELSILGNLIHSYPKVPTHITKRYKNIIRYIKTEHKALRKYLKELKI